MKLPSQTLSDPSDSHCKNLKYKFSTLFFIHFHLGEHFVILREIKSINPDYFMFSFLSV